MRVIFDHNVPHKLRRMLSGYYIQTADEMGWAALANGLLLRAAEEASFDVMVTCDQNIYYQQNLVNRSLAIVVLSTNYWPAIKLRTQDVLAALDSCRPGSFLVVSILRD